MWHEFDNKLYKRFVFPDFRKAFAFMTKVAVVADELDHHPKWTNQDNAVEIFLTTHDAGNIVTEKDRILAKAIDGQLAN
jgi:4a-hydroxytetrahydrobiopterin dehydratase